MREIGLILWPLLAAAAAFFWPNRRSRPWFLPVAGVGHAALALWLLVDPPAGAAAGGWIGFDPAARAVLPAVSLLFLACSIYGVTYLQLRSERPNHLFVAVFLVLLGLISLALQAQHLGLLWVAVEAATLSTVPLLHFNRTARAVEAAWKYLLIGGTGVALSLLGSFCLGYASLYDGGGGDLTFAKMAAQFGGATHEPHFYRWIVMAWALLLTGYGTKMGLAPMHTWKPDAYGEAPGIVGALLAGGMTTIAFVAILRVKQTVDAVSGDARVMTSHTLLALGLFSMLVAALFLLGTPDFKRMLAYSSVEHMGILCVGAALGGAGLWAALYHVWNNSLTKGALFMSAGNMRRAAGGSRAGEAIGLAWLTPVSARIFIAGLFAVTACPPFGPFFSELLIVRSAFAANQKWAATLFLACLFLAFCGITRLGFAVVDGRARGGRREVNARFRETASILAPPLALLGLSLWLGLNAPTVLRNAWTAAASNLSTLP